jgi:hypothetical protein
MATDDLQGIRWDCRPRLPLNRASDSAGRHRPRTEDRFDPHEQNTQIATRLAKTPLSRGKSRRVRGRADFRQRFFGETPRKNTV